jgi:2-hydroxy-3-oxopropionate reductase
MAADATGRERRRDASFGRGRQPSMTYDVAARAVRGGTVGRVVGWVGLGIMGKPMASRLLAAGFDVEVFNRSRGVIEQLVQAGAREADSLSELASRCDVIFTMLPDTSDVRDVLEGEAGLLVNGRPGTVIVDMSTIDIGETIRLGRITTAQGLRYLDAPVSGGEAGAIAGTLSVMVGGESATLDEVRPLLECLGTKIVHLGPNGAGQLCKACNQIVVAVTVQAVAEALLLARKSGIDPAAVREAMMAGLAQSRILEIHGARILDRNFEPGFRAALHAKDLRLALAEAYRLSVPLPAAAAVAQELNAMKASTLGDMDHSAIALVLENMGTP